MDRRGSWTALRNRRMREPGAWAAYHATRRAIELGASVRQLRESHGWSQSELARRAGMTQPAIARFESGGTVPTIPVLEKLARALDAKLIVRVESGDAVA